MDPGPDQARVEAPQLLVNDSIRGGTWMNKTQIILVDNHVFFRVSCCRLLEKEQELEITGECSTAGEAINLIKERFPDIVILDPLFAYTSALEIIDLLKKYSPKTRYVILTSVLREQVKRELLKAGVRAFVAKEDMTESLVPAIRSAMKDQIYLSSSVQKYFSGQLDTQIAS
jgi:DNA-binding NarL/FixJ family response regulator